MSEPRWVLEVLGGEGGSVELPAAGTLVLGCTRERAGFVLEGQGVDEAHCVIGRTKEGDWAVKDLGSRYGTFVNGQRVAASRLKLGDQLVLGSRRLEVRPFQAEAAGTAAAGVGSARPADVPQRIGGYRIERLIGKGAMGAVYLAVQESLRRPVALKVMTPKLASDRDFVRRFQAEARSAAALSHPNVVVVYDVGEESGTHYLSMEFMAGGSLEQKLSASGPLSWKAVLGVLHDAAAGLAYAESRGIVHRDIKPANLMYSGTGTVKIADLGLATTLEQEASEAVDGRKVYGTPHFIAPEQARGEAVDNRSDLYALGATAYRLLSGKTPFEGATTREILRALQNEEPRPLRELVSDLPPELEALIRRLMEKDPAARFPTGEALRRECERLRLVAEHGPTLEVPRPRPRRALALLLLLLAGGAGAAWYALALRPGAAPRAPQADLGAETQPDAPPDDEGFFAGPPDEGAAAPDEEAALRAREREAGQALREIAPFLAGAERIAALERIQSAYAGTAAATAAANEIAALRTLPGALGGATLEEADQELAAELDELARKGATTLGAELAAIQAFRAPPELGGEFEARRAARAVERIRAHEERVRLDFARATQLGVEGRFAELRTFLEGLEAHFTELDALPGDPARLAGLQRLRQDLAERRARVDEEERFFLATAERKRRRTLGEALGPDSGCLAEVAALDLAAIELRLGALAAELQTRAVPAALAAEARQARTALETLRREFEGGGWRRKQLVDPRTKRPREVRDLRPEGLVFDKDGALETFPWREARSDPEWWHGLFQARLTRDWSPAEARAIAGLLRLVAAARGAELAREMLAPSARGLLQPSELEALGNVFAPALGWIGAHEARPAFEHESECARLLARALGAAQGRAWTQAVVDLERVLRECGDSLLVGLLSDGLDWQVEAPAPKAAGAPRAPGSPPDAPGNGGGK